MKENKHYIYQIDLLRGIASLMVLTLHLTASTPYFPDNHFLKPITHYGKYGVEIFFVISGFVIPFSMHYANYSLSKMHKFLAKRMIRIEIPYLSMAVIALIFSWVATQIPFYNGVPFNKDWVGWLMHIGYINAFYAEDHPWIIAVFWTLAIEFQYYLLIALFFTVIKGEYGRLLFYASMLTFAASYLFINGEFITLYSSYFIIGIICFRYKCGYSGKIEFWISFVGAIAFIYIQHNAAGFIAGSVTSLVILFFPYQSRLSTFLGKISFSLYLIHPITGMRFQNLAMRVIPENLRLLFLPIFYGTSILSAVIFYKLIEKPALKLSKKIKIN